MRPAIVAGVALLFGLLMFSTTQLAAQFYYGIPIEERGVAFLLDTSGSMESKDEGGGRRGGLLRGAVQELSNAARRTGVGQTRLGEAVINRAESETTKMGSARRELASALGSLTGWTRFTIVTFGNRAQEWPGGLRLAGRGEKAAAQAFAIQLSADGGTPMAEAMQIAFGYPEVHTVFLVSDGQPTTGDVRGLVRRLQASRRGEEVVINTVGIGPDQDEALLCALARDNHGVYVKDGQVQCSPSPCPPIHEIITYYRPGHTKRHHYTETNAICTIGQKGCTAAEVYATMVSSARFGAPSTSTSPVRNCSRLNLRFMQWSNLLGGIVERAFDADPVIVHLEEGALQQTNYTLPGHLFHPGKITRTVSRSGNQVIVTTEGVGIGDYPFFNMVAGRQIFRAIDRDLAEAVRSR